MAIFPEGGLDQSILVAVLVGVFVLLAFTEIFGWVWAGLVVPGYLASVFAIQPAAGIAICFEATLTFVVSRAASDSMSRWGGWSPFFGRERFFLIVLVSVIVRQACELWVIDDLLSLVDRQTGSSLAASHDFASIGLVLVPLLANMAWKLSLRRAAFQIGVSVALTWIIVVLVLLQFTNLSYSSLELTYENVALDFLGSPKAYIILLTTAFLAARFNLTYGWDYNGILVPSLIALTWFRPWLLVSTVFEALVLCYAARAALALPLLKRRNLEGPRKLALVFSVGFVLKLALGWTLALWFPKFRLTELFGFGYVLTSLIAVKMLNLKKTGRVILPSVAVSLVGYVAASGIGFGLEQLAPRTATSSRPAPADVATSQRLWRTPAGIMALATVRAQGDRGARAAEIDRHDLVAYGALWGGIDAWLRSTRALPDDLAARAAELGLRFVPVPGTTRPAWALLDGDEQLATERGWDTALLFPGAPGPVIEVPRPRRDQPAAEAAAVLCEPLRCRAVLVSGSDSRGDDPQQRAPFHAAHRALEETAVLELRSDATIARGHPRLHVRHALPEIVRLPAVWPSPVELTWDPPPGADERWRRVSPLVVLRVHPEDLWQRLAATVPAVTSVPHVSVVGWLDAWLARMVADAPAPPPPSLTELLVLERLVLERLAERRAEHAPWIAELARSLDHEISWLPDGAPSGGAWGFAGATDRGWLAAAVAEHPAVPLVLEVPRPHEENGIGRVASQVWEAAGATAIVLDSEWSANTIHLHPAAGYPDAVAPGNVATAFQAAHQALSRSLGSAAGAAIVQLRGFAPWRPVRDDAIISLGVPLLDPGRAPPAIARLIARDGVLGRLATTVRWVDGSADVAELAGAGGPQLLYAQANGGAPFAIAWLAEPIRAGALPVGDRDDTKQRAARLGMAFVERPIATALTADLGAPAHSRDVPDRVAAALAFSADYGETGDLAALAQVSHVRGVTAALGWSADLRASYVLVEAREHGSVIRAAVLAGTVDVTACTPIDAGPGAEARTWQAIQTRCGEVVVIGEATR